MAVGAPLALGGVHRATIALLALIAVASIAACWRYRQVTKRPLSIPWYGWALAALLGYTLLQLIPLPIRLLHLVAPSSAEIIRLSLKSTGAAGGWHPISLVPAATLWESVKLGACLLAFITAHNMLARSGRRERLLAALGIAGAALVFLGIIGSFVAPGKPLLFYQPAQGVATGVITTSFVNPNHSAALLLICTLAAAGLAMADIADAGRRLLWLVVAGACGAGVFLSLSRGGLGALAVALVLLAISLLKRRSRQTNRSARSLALLLVAVGAVVIGATVLAFNELTADTLPHATRASLSKLAVLPDGAKMALEHAFLGVGRGAFGAVFPKYMGSVFAGKVSFPYLENQYLQLPIELGIPAGVAIISASLIALIGWYRRRGDDMPSLVMLCALAALALHNAVDFNLELLGVALPAAIIAGLLSANARARSSSSRASVRGSITVGLVCLWVLGGSVYSLVAHPRTHGQNVRALLQSLRSVKGRPPQRLIDRAKQLARDAPGDYLPQLVLGSALLARDKRQAIVALNRAAYLFPQNADIHIVIARALRRFGRRGQALIEYRMALAQGAAPLPILQQVLPLCRELTQIRRLLPDQPAIHAEAAALLVRMGRPREADRLVARARTRWPKSRVVAVARVQTLTAIGQVKGAAELAGKLARDGVDAKAYIRWAEALGRGAPQVAALQAAVARFNNNVALRFQLATAHMRVGAYTKAAKQISHVLSGTRTLSTRIRAHEALARVYRAMKRSHRAQIEDRKARELKRIAADSH